MNTIKIPGFSVTEFLNSDFFLYVDMQLSRCAATMVKNYFVFLIVETIKI
jgi:hypothetical protein